MMSDEDLLGQFVGAFAKLGNMTFVEALLEPDLLPPEMNAGLDGSPWARTAWKPAAITTDETALVEMYKNLPSRFPPLYEQLVLSYRWLQIDLNGFLTLLANSPGPSLASLVANITADRVFVDVLFPLGLIPFARATGGCYDPVCFDTSRRRADGDRPVVRIDHEAVLCDGRIGDQWEVAESFRSLVEAVIVRADAMPDESRLDL